MLNGTLEWLAIAAGGAPNGGSPSGFMRIFEQPVPFGDYLLLGEIGRGGMAEIFRARPLKGGPDVVVKRMLSEHADPDTGIPLFLEEARVQASLDHDNIVRILDFGEHDAQYFIVMEYVPGRDLARLMIRGRRLKRPINTQMALYAIVQAAAGLDYLHRAADEKGRQLNLVHRDINPANIFISWQGAVKLGDFGIVRSQFRERHTKEGSFRGTLGYMAPEQVRAEQLDGRADLYSLGCVLYECLCGQTAFKGETDTETLRQNMNSRFPPPSQVNPQIGHKLERIVLRAMTQDKTKRYQTAQEMSEDLLEYMYQQRLKLDAKPLANLLRSLYQAEFASETALYADGLPAMEAQPRPRPAAMPTDTYALSGPSGEPVGPFDKAALGALLAAGKIDGREPVAKNGGPFRPFERYPELKALVITRLVRERAEAAREAQEMQHRKMVLVVDGDLLVLRTVQDALEPAGFRVLATDNPSEVVTLAAAHHPDLIISGIVLPGTDGYQLLARLTQNPVVGHIPVVFLTARDGLRERLRGFRYGAIDYIRKPLDSDELVKRVKAIVYSMPFRDGNYQGNFRETGFPSILEILATDKKTGVLSLNLRSETGRVFFVSGRPEQAFLGDLEGDAVLERLAAVTTGTFRFFELAPNQAELLPVDAPPQRPAHTGEVQILDDTEAGLASDGQSGPNAGDLDRIEAVTAVRDTFLRPDQIPNHYRDILLISAPGGPASGCVESLTASGFQPKLVSDPAQGLSTALAIRPAVIVSDVRFPAADGWDLCFRARNERMLRETPFILMLAHAHEREDLRRLDSGRGADDYFDGAAEGMALVARLCQLLTPFVELERDLRLSTGNAVRGRLESIGLVTVIEMAHRHGLSLDIRAENLWGTGQLLMRGGELRAAEVMTGEPCQGFAALVQVLAWDAGDLLARHSEAPAAGNLDGALGVLLAGAASEVNAAHEAAMRGALLDAARLEVEDGRLALYETIAPPNVLWVIDMIRANMSPKEIIAASGAPRAETENILGHLHKKRMVRLAGE